MTGKGHLWRGEMHLSLSELFSLEVFTCGTHGRSPSVPIRWLGGCQVERQSFLQQLPVALPLSLTGLGPRGGAAIRGPCPSQQLLSITFIPVLK